jgi:hypothetical protein
MSKDPIRVRFFPDGQRGSFGAVAALHSRTRRKGFFGDHLPASTLLGVNALVEPEVLIEVDAVAVLESLSADP